MSDIELVIKISEEKFNTIKSKMYCGIYDADLYKAIANGTPLPKGHGVLVDYEELKNNAREYGAYSEANLSHIKPKIIIEADKAESEEV